MSTHSTLVYGRGVPVLWRTSTQQTGDGETIASVVFLADGVQSGVVTVQNTDADALIYALRHAADELETKARLATGAAA